jgi:DNA-binding NarL/FixJ family response regulator
MRHGDLKGQVGMEGAVRPGAVETAEKIRVYVVAENRLLREAMSRILGRHGSISVMGSDFGEAFDAGRLARENADVALVVSQEKLQGDLDVIHAVRAAAPGLKILLMGSAKEDGEFLQYVRAGISGYLWRDASSDDVAQGIENVYAGKAVCPGELCTTLFRYLERAEPALSYGSPRQRLGLTRREQQIVPLIAKGLTNKEIANHFCLSEQTVKNHLYRMKHKIGAEDRLSIVQRFRTHGFLL